jgi:hypothetical protein
MSLLRILFLSLKMVVTPDEVGWIATVLVELAKIQRLIGLDAVRNADTLGMLAAARHTGTGHILANS